MTIVAHRSKRDGSPPLPVVSLYGERQAFAVSLYGERQAFAVSLYGERQAFAVSLYGERQAFAFGEGGGEGLRAVDRAYPRTRRFAPPSLHGRGVGRAPAKGAP
jgi:hypothetical protein